MNIITPKDYEKEMMQIIDSAIKRKKQNSVGNVIDSCLKGKTLGMIFFNPSLRTRTSFEVGMYMLGGHAVNLEVGSGMWNLEHRDKVVMDGACQEHVKDAAKVLGRYADMIAVRSFPGFNDWEEDKKDIIINAFAEHSGVPVINMESCTHHPCQALADMMTIKEHLGSFGNKFVLSWAYHPKALPMAVPNSALVAAAMAGMDITLACPKGYELDEEILSKAREYCMLNNSSFEICNERDDAYKGAHIIYAKSWIAPSHYGKVSPHMTGMPDYYKQWIIDAKVMEKTDNAKFMHCLPVRRNVVVSDGVMDSDSSIVYDQAENRLHAQNELLRMLGGKNA